MDPGEVGVAGDVDVSGVQGLQSALILRRELTQQGVGGGDVGCVGCREVVGVGTQHTHT